MKILHVIAQLPAATGSGVYFSKVISEYKARNIDQAAIFGQPKGYRWKLIPKTYPVTFGLDLDFPIVGMSDVMPYESTRYRDLTKEQVDQWKGVFRKRLEQAIHEFQPDVILTHHTWLLSALVVEIFDGPVYGFCHNTDLRQRKINPHFATDLAPLQKIDGVFTSGKSEHYELIYDFGIVEKKLHPLGGAYDSEIFHSKGRVESDKIRYTYAGKLCDTKGTLELIDAFIALKDKNTELNLIGKAIGDMEERIYDRIKGHKNISLLPPVTQKELGDHFRRQDIFILPSYYEGMPLSPIEALACGCSVIMTENDNLKDLVGNSILDCGWIDFLDMPRLRGIDEIHPEAREDFIQVLKESMKKQQQWKNVLPGEEVRREIESHSWTGLVNQIQEIILREQDIL